MRSLLRVVVPVISFLTYVNSNAQISQIGITGGWNVSSFSGIHAASRSGVVIGGFMSYNLGSGLSIEPQVLFSMQGATRSNYNFAQGIGEPGFVALSTWTLNYVEVPILLKLDVLSVPIFPGEIDLYAGPDFAFNVASENKTTLGGVGPNPITSTYDGSSITHPFDFNIAVGCGPNFVLGTIRVGVEARYTFSTGSPFKGAWAFGQSGPARNSVWSIMASVGF